MKNSRPDEEEEDCDEDDDAEGGPTAPVIPGAAGAVELVPDPCASVAVC
jgi:hypothetical protein